MPATFLVASHPNSVAILQVVRRSVWEMKDDVVLGSGEACPEQDREIGEEELVVHLDGDQTARTVYAERRTLSC